MKIKFHIGIGYANANQEEIVDISEEELGNTTLEEYCDQYLQDMLSNCLDTAWWRVDDETQR